MTTLDANDIPLHLDRAMTWPAGHYFGVYPATVSGNQDPSGQGRVQVHLPWSPDPAGGQYEVWARLATMMAVRQPRHVVHPGGRRRGPRRLPRRQP